MSSKEILETHALYANWVAVSRYPAVVRITFGEGSGSAESCLYHSAVVMDMADAIALRDLLSKAIESEPTATRQ